MTITNTITTAITAAALLVSASAWAGEASGYGRSTVPDGALGASVGRVELARGAAACGPHAQIVAKLSSQYQEQAVNLGLGSNGNVMQIFSTAGGDTWTLLSTNPAGMSCVLASGRHWQSVTLKPTGPEV